MSHQGFIQNSVIGNYPRGWFLCQILWSSESSPSKGTPQCLLTAFEPVNWLEQKRELNLQTPVPPHVGRAEYPEGVNSGAYTLSPLEVLNKGRW